MNSKITATLTLVTILCYGHTNAQENSLDQCFVKDFNQCLTLGEIVSLNCKDGEKQCKDTEQMKAVCLKHIVDKDLHSAYIPKVSTSERSEVIKEMKRRYCAPIYEHTRKHCMISDQEVIELWKKRKQILKPVRENCDFVAAIHACYEISRANLFVELREADCASIANALAVECSALKKNGKSLPGYCDKAKGLSVVLGIDLVKQCRQHAYLDDNECYVLGEKTKKQKRTFTVNKQQNLVRLPPKLLFSIIFFVSFLSAW